jgi:hypothetical protein
MYHQVCYVIKPQPSFIEFLKSYKTSILSSSEVWVLGTGGYGAPRPEELAIGVKLFYMARFRSLLIEQNIENHVEILEKLMGQPPFHETVFDRWWTLEKYGTPNEFNVVASWILPDQLALMQASESAKVNGWIANVEDLIRRGVLPLDDDDE